MTIRPRQPLDAGSIRGTTEDEVLRAFVASVRQWRDSTATSPVFRRDDLIVLAGVFGTDAADIERQLISLTGCDRPTAKRLRRLLLARLALPVAFTVLTNAQPQVAGAPAGPFVEEQGLTRAALVVDLAAADVPAADLPAATPAKAVRVVDTTVVPAPIPAPDPAPDPAPAPTSTDVSVAPGSEATVSIARLGIELPVVAGGQDVIDQGVAAHFWAAGWREPVAAGAVGTYWLAGHQSTHGAPFALVPDMVVGDTIVVATVGPTFTYTVTSMEVVEEDAGFGPVYGADPTASVILLQTCLDDVQRLLVHGTLTAVA